LALIPQRAPWRSARIAEGTLANFGRYTVDEKAGTFTVAIEKSSFPNFDGVKQTRTLLVLTDDTLE
jgi:Lipocalin-like domain